MRQNTVLAAFAVLSLSCGVAFAQTTQPSSSRSSGQSAAGQSPSGEAFSFQGDQIQPMPDQRQINPRDQRYSQTYQQQQNGEIPKPGGGCLRYGAVGAAGGHLAGHGVLGAVAGCATGAYVRHRDKARIANEYGKQ